MPLVDTVWNWTVGLHTTWYLAWTYVPIRKTGAHRFRYELNQPTKTTERRRIELVHTVGLYNNGQLAAPAYGRPSVLPAERVSAGRQVDHVCASWPLKRASVDCAYERHIPSWSSVSREDRCNFLFRPFGARIAFGTGRLTNAWKLISASAESYDGARNDQINSCTHV